jgi:hypothetical protein
MIAVTDAVMLIHGENHSSLPLSFQDYLHFVVI